MSSPILGIGGKDQGNVSLMASAVSVDGVSHNGLGLKEHNYMGLSDCSSVGSCTISSLTEENKDNLNLKATELRLGLPGSQSPERDSVTVLSVGNLDEKQLFPLVPSKIVCSGNKRGFSDTVEGFSESKSSIFSEGNWRFNTSSDPGQEKLPGSCGTNVVLSNRQLGVQSSVKAEVARNVLEKCNNKMDDSNTNNAPASKAQVVGWPPIRSFRKNTLAANLRNNVEVDGKPGPGALYVKVSMDGAPYLRKVDLRMYSTYQELSTALEKMFSCFTLGQCEHQGAHSKEMLCESKLKDLLHGSEYVLTYKDKDGDWMLVGDVPWEMFISSCKRLKIMKGSDAIGLAPKAIEKSMNQN